MIPHSLRKLNGNESQDISIVAIYMSQRIVKMNLTLNGSNGLVLDCSQNTSSLDSQDIVVEYLLAMPFFNCFTEFFTVSFASPAVIFIDVENTTSKYSIQAIELLKRFNLDAVILLKTTSSKLIRQWIEKGSYFELCLIWNNFELDHDWKFGIYENNEMVLTVICLIFIATLVILIVIKSCILIGLNESTPNEITLTEFLKKQIYKHDTSREPNCPICLSTFREGENICLLNCHHTFHYMCMSKWNQNACPMCRAEVISRDETMKNSKISKLFKYFRNAVIRTRGSPPQSQNEQQPSEAVSTPEESVVTGNETNLT